MFRFDHTGIREIARDWENFGAKNSAHRRAMFKAAAAVRRQTRQDLNAGGPVQKRSGRLGRSLRINMLTTVRGVEAEVVPTAHYAAILEEGRTIRAKNPTGRLRFPLAFAGASMIRGGVFRRNRAQMERLAEKAGAKKSATYTHTRSEGSTYRGRAHRKGESYYSSGDLKPFRTGMSKNFEKLVGRGGGFVGVGWVSPQQVTIPAFGWLASSAEKASDQVAEILGDGFHAQLVRQRLGAA